MEQSIVTNGSGGMAEVGVAQPLDQVKKVKEMYGPRTRTFLARSSSTLARGLAAPPHRMHCVGSCRIALELSEAAVRPAPPVSDGE